MMLKMVIKRTIAVYGIVGVLIGLGMFGYSFDALNKREVSYKVRKE